MVRTRAHPRGAVHDHPRHRDRQRRAAVDSARSRVLAGEPAVGDQRLRARLRRIPPAGRSLRRPPRPAAHLHGRNAHLHARLAALRARVERGVADRVPRAPGSRRGDAHAGRAVDPRRDVRRGSRAQHRAGRLGSRRRRGRRGRRPLRRHPRRLPLVGVDLLRQRPGGRRRADPRADPPLGEPRQARPGLRHSGRRPRHVGSLASRSRHHAGERLGLELGQDDRRLRRRPRCCCSRSSAGSGV